MLASPALHTNPTTLQVDPPAGKRCKTSGMATIDTCADDDVEIVKVTPNDDKDSSSEEDDASYDGVKTLRKPVGCAICKKTGKILWPKKQAFGSDSEE